MESIRDLTSEKKEKKGFQELDFYWEEEELLGGLRGNIGAVNWVKKGGEARRGEVPKVRLCLRQIFVPPFTRSHFTVFSCCYLLMWRRGKKKTYIVWRGIFFLGMMLVGFGIGKLADVGLGTCVGWALLVSAMARRRGFSLVSWDRRFGIIFLLTFLISDVLIVRGAKRW